MRLVSVLTLLLCISSAIAQSPKPAHLSRLDFVDFSFSTPTSSVNLNLRNSGGSAALNVHGTFTVTLYVNGKAGHSLLSQAFTFPTLPPVNLHAAFVPKKFPFTLSSDDLSLIENGLGQARVAGTLTYEDVPSHAVTMPFCYKYDFPQGIRGCSK